MPAGRPATYQTVEELEIELVRYFEETPSEEQTVTWLALFLWFVTRQWLLNYECKPEFVDAVKRAKLRVEHSYELSLRKNGRSWDIFWLKNFWWVDKSEVDNNNKNSWEMTIKWDA